MNEKIKPDDISFENLMAQIKEGTIKIPDFQRDFVWERSQIVNLLDSIYHHYPIGSFLFWESNEDICSYKNIGNIELKPAPKGKSINYVLDGQQRITSLFASLEEAEIKVKVNGKLKKRKLKIFFNLDKKEFTTTQEEEAEDDTLTKYKAIWLFPRKGDYVKNLLNILNAVDSNNHDEESLKKWFVNEFGVSEHSAKAYVTILRRMGFVEFENNKLVLSYLSREFTETKDTDTILRLILRNVALFREVIEKVLEQKEVDVEELREHLEKTYEVDWQSAEQTIYRLKWLWKLGYGKFSKNKFILDEEFSEKLKKIISEELEIESKEVVPEEKNEVYLVSIKDIVDYRNALTIFKKLTPERQNSFEEVMNRFKSYKFSVIYVKEQPIGTVCHIFERINNSGTVLNVVDLMVAKTWSNEFNLKEKLFEFQKQLKSNHFEDIADITIIQCISTHIQKNCKRKDILELTRKQFLDVWKNSTEAIKKSVDFLRKNLKITNSKILPYGSMLVPLSYFYYKLGNKDETNVQRKSLIEWFWKASVSSRFDSAVEGKIADDVKKIDKLIKNEEVVFSYIIPQITEERIIEQNYSLRSAFCKTIMCLYANQNPKHLENNMPVDFDAFSKFNAVEYHHIFPQNYLKREQPENFDSKDSITNIAFVPSGANKKFRDKSPRDYLKELSNPSIDLALKSHLISNYKESGLLENDFTKFLNYRAKIILKQIKSLVGEFTAVEQGMLESEEKQVDAFEEKIRELISSKVEWQNLNKEFTDKVEERITQWLNKHPSEKRENVRPIDFCLIMDYFRIMKINWALFEPTFKSKTELEKHFLHINELRNAIKHSRKVDLATKKLAEASLVWFEQIFKGE